MAEGEFTLLVICNVHYFDKGILDKQNRLIIIQWEGGYLQCTVPSYL
jgi:hypothetical protein